MQCYARSRAAAKVHSGRAKKHSHGAQHAEFARPSTTFALDSPNQRERIKQLFHRLHTVALEAGGALYSAKDARMPRHMFEVAYPRLQTQAVSTYAARKHLLSYSLLEQTRCENDLRAGRRALEVNAVSPVLWLEAFGAQIQDGSPAKIVRNGSIAGERGRKSNYVYSASKGLLEHYTQGVQNRLVLRGCGLKVILTKPCSLKRQCFRVSRSEGGGFLVKAIERGTVQGSSMIFASKIWRITWLIIDSLPIFIFHRSNLY